MAEMEVEVLPRSKEVSKKWDLFSGCSLVSPLRPAQNAGCRKCELPGAGRHTGSFFLSSVRVCVERGVRRVDLGVSGGVGKQELVLFTLTGLGFEVWEQSSGREERH